MTRSIAGQYTISNFNVPSRLSVDGGSENGYMNKLFMCLRNYRDDDEEEEKNPLTIGRSVHNIKIEHQWRFVQENIVDKYRDLYDRMKGEYDAFPRHNDCSPVQ